ncbi:cysteinyl-tRNA synthetase [Desulfonatronum thiosulfatophilum]|uniref:Cysteine--tRNA ligase n=1 Tax=Desulfonatronum thiosulfatophilum TaxID=617002 RepID=A0A1G6A9D3_9BACT|nr:cysteine--tRNA ligase [Desulfonatronum thiosulfatophilum]SDB05045.1 cysteinyl-tRNA synthetase [Desulfonatronum thiosulfatophilum]
MLLYNSLHGKKEEFQPLRDNHVRLYVCGITAYDYCHIGHARSAVVFDVLVRYLRHRGWEVTFVRNFTDIDDKIIKRAATEGLSSAEVAEKYIAAFYEDMDRLGILRADYEPRATEHIPGMIRLNESLIERGYAYATDQGDVYFRVRAFEGYGRLSGRNIEELRSGARVEPGESKEDPLDFALWKSAKPGEPSWPSPWGPGRPGWHLECSVMSEQLLGLPLDIHGGGQDLSFPHHENEMAQSMAATGGEFVRFWVHNGFVQVNAEKMSKSLGNFVTIRDILAKFNAEVLRFFLLTKHYRSPLDFSFSSMEEAEKALQRIYQTMALLSEHVSGGKWNDTALPAELETELAAMEDDWIRSMEDDLNTAGALGHVFGVVRLGNRMLENKAWRKSAASRNLGNRILEDLQRWGQAMGLFQAEPASWLAALKDIRVQRRELSVERINELLAARQDARQAKDFQRADAVRHELAELGVEVRDTPGGQVWDVG